MFTKNFFEIHFCNGIMKEIFGGINSCFIAEHNSPEALASTILEWKNSKVVKTDISVISQFFVKNIISEYETFFLNIYKIIINFYLIDTMIISCLHKIL